MGLTGLTTSKYTALAELEALVGASIAHTGEPWPEPEPLGGELPPVAVLMPEMLPPALRAMIEDVAHRMQTPLDFPEVVAVQTLAGLVNRRAVIQPKREDSSWLVVPNLWGAIVADPGMMKSPIIGTITAPAKDLEREWTRDHDAAAQTYHIELEAAELQLQGWKKNCLAAQSAGKQLPPRPAPLPEAPAQKRLLTSDATFESLHAMLSKNPAGIFNLRDELTGWLAQLERQGREPERAFYLEAWNGDSAYTLDRIGRGSVRVDHTCVSLFGAIQPSRLRFYLADTLSGGPANDGLIQRFQLLVWPDATKQKWEYVDRVPNGPAKARAEDVYRRLALMDPVSPAFFRFDNQAQALFIEWLTQLERQIRAPQTGDIMRAHLAKYRKLMPALSLLFALAEGAQQYVSLCHAQLAAAWCDYLETHARRVYSAQSTPEQAAAASLGQKLAAGMLGRQTFSLRNLYQKHWSGLTTPEEARPALRYLEELQWVRPVPPPEGKMGRKSETFSINPRLEEKHAG